MSVSKINYNDKNEAYIIVDPISEIDKDDFKKYMDLDSPSFLSCEFENDKVFTLFYSYDKYIPLKTFLSQVINKEKALTFLKSLTKAYIEASDNHMNLNHILLGVNSIFCHSETYQAACIYVPVIDGVLPERPLRIFLKELLVNIMYSEEDDMTWLGDLIRYISRNRQLNYVEFYEFLETLDDKKTVSTKEQTFESQVDTRAQNFSDAAAIENVKNIIESSEQIKLSKDEKEPDNTCYLYRRSDHSMYILGKKNMRIGKALDNEICIKDNPVISRVHAIIRYMDGAYVIQDNGSTNHTFVNGFVLAPEHSKTLSSNDRILLGNEEFIFKN